MNLFTLAQTTSPGGAEINSWAPVVLLILVGLGFTVGNLVISIFIGPARTGDIKSSTYESGMVPFGDARRRFNVRFYIVAMIFLVFDVDIIFFYPWATIFAPAVRASAAARESGGHDVGGAVLIEMFVFVAILLLAYLYAWEGRISLGLIDVFSLADLRD